MFHAPNSRPTFAVSLWGRFHLSSAELRYNRECTLLTVDCHPLVGVFAVGEGDSVAQVAGSERSRRMFHQVILVCALGNVLLWFECLTGPTRTGGEEEQERPPMQNAETTIRPIIRHNEWTIATRWWWRQLETLHAPVFHLTLSSGND